MKLSGQRAYTSAGFDRRDVLAAFPTAVFDTHQRSRMKEAGSRESEWVALTSSRSVEVKGER